MRLYLTILLVTLYTLTTTAQNKMRTVEELINKTDPGWILVAEWIKSAKNKVEILPVDTTTARDALHKTQVTTRSPMGAIIYMTGGLLIDDGWIRILGSGSSKINRRLPDWNKGKSFKEFGESPPFLLIADDAIGGFYLLNGGGLGTDLGKVYYFSPDNLEYEPLGLTYTEFLHFCFDNDLDKFYEGSRWTNWRNEVSNLNGEEVFNFFPPLWAEEGKDVNKNSRKIISIEEQYHLNLDMRRQLGLER
ncbi:DUF2625 domain-containing protein [Chitinophaga filiformis]|uniref:DUF2625 domain-containing protein n=1 Tax=Chitinophaga filiformis TaxID=104663 RepID=UPI001F33F449|nr:DUF2625 domain-containing protein [Chitinophaga filiformis]MCF6405461.1 DUF2625 domain-containing protein [Chitinophaga filiformis]